MSPAPRDGFDLDEEPPDWIDDRGRPHWEDRNGDEPQPPPHPADEDVPDEPGDAVLDDVHAALCRYVAFPSAHASVAMTLFVAATHAQVSWEHATRLVIKSPLKRCGKTRLLEIAGELVHRPLRTTNISVAALVRSIDAEDPPTVVLDEADAVFATRRGERSEGAEDLRGILNSGHSPGWPYIRWNMSTRQRESCPTFAMAIVSGIGDLPDTIEDRAVVISMRRRAPGEQVAQFRRRRSIPPLRALHLRLHAWASRRLDLLGEADPDLPVEDRQADVWAPLVAVADAAGGRWPSAARVACVALVGVGDGDDSSAAELLLSDLRVVFRDDEDEVATATVLDRLHELDESPWSEWFGKPLSARALARLLRPYGIRSRNVRTGDGQAKGYRRDDLVDAWARYLAVDVHGPGSPLSPSVPASQPLEFPGQLWDGSGTDSEKASVPDGCRSDVPMGRQDGPGGM